MRQSEEMDLLAGLSRAVEAARDCPTLGNEVERGDFGPEGRGVAGQLYAAFARAARRAVGHEHADLPWQALRQLALELHNERKKTEAALRLTAAILSFAPAQPSAEMTERLRDDEATLRRELRWSEASALAQAGRFTEALERLRALEAVAKDAAERQRIATIRSQLTQRRNQVTRRRIGWAVAAGVIGLIGLANLASEPVQPRAASSR